MGEAEEYRCLVEFPEYEISRAGVVRRVGGRAVSARVKQGSGVQWVQLSRDYKQYGRTLSVLLVEAFGPGAAQAAGIKEPDMRRVGRSRGRVGRAKSTRVCHNCGRPTANFRCDECWRGIRGYGAAAASDHASPFDN